MDMGGGGHVNELVNSGKGESLIAEKTAMKKQEASHQR